MPDTTTEALFKVGQLVEWRGGPGLDFQYTGRVRSVRDGSGYPESGGWIYEIDGMPPRPQSSGGKFQGNLRPLFEEGDVVRVSDDPKCRSRASDEEPRSGVLRQYHGQEARIHNMGHGVRDSHSNYAVQLLGDPDRGDYNVIAPEHLTLVRKAGESAPAAAAPSYRYHADGWVPQVGDRIEVRASAREPWHEYGTINSIESGFHYAYTDRNGSAISRAHYEAGHVRLVVAAQAPAELREGMRVRIAEDASTVARPDAGGRGYVDQKFKGAEGILLERATTGNWKVQFATGPEQDYNYIHPDYLTPLGEAPAQPAAPEPWDISRVKVGDRVEVYSGAGGYPAGTRDAAAHRLGGFSWKEGVVTLVDSEDRNMTLRVKVGDADSWYHYNANVRPVQAPALAVAVAADVQAAIDKALAEYKAQIRDRALQAAQEHGWCSQAEACLKELGIDPQTEYAAEVTVTFKVSAKVAENYTRSGIENPARFLKDNLAPTLTTRYGLSSADVSIERVQINNVTKN